MHMKMSAVSNPDTVDWATNDLERVEVCPVCSSPDRQLLIGKLRDRIFYCAPGEWDLQDCARCHTGYLDPRPTPQSIHRAYENYYTHDHVTSQPAEQLGGFRKWQRMLANGYKNSRFGTRLEPASSLGPLVAFLLPVQRAILDRQFRELKRGFRGRVLDVGCGDASFLESARDMGWHAVGTDFDPVVVENARKRGLEVQLGTLDAVVGPFDAITMCHVIEHLHDPVAELRRCYDLLAPGGTVWIETPSIAALGLKRFGPDWRGLEPPRHLVLFNRGSLKTAFHKAGFTDVADVRQPNSVLGMWMMSTRIRDGVGPSSNRPLSRALRCEIAVVKLVEWLWKPRREFLCMIARKPE